MNKISIVGFFVMFASLQVMANEVELDKRRVARAHQDWTDRAAAKREITTDQFYLVSFSRNLTQRELLAGIGVAGIDITALHVCGGTRLITALFPAGKGSPAQQIDVIRNQLRPQANQVFGRFPSTEPGKFNDLSESKIPEEFKVCGIEFKAARTEASSLVERMNRDMKMIEVTHKRVRQLPIFTAQ